MIHLAALTIADDPATWGRLGFATDAGATTVGTTVHQLVGTDGGAKGIVGWTLSGDIDPGITQIEGLPTTVTTGAPQATTEAHANGVLTIDHLVVMTPDVERTVAALEALGLPCRRRRQGEAYGKPMSQAFFWLGNPDGTDAEKVVLEVVGSPEPDPAQTDSPAKFFGIAYTVADLEATGQFFGDLMKPPFDAVQPGRRITTISSKAGANVAIALMSAHVAPS